MSGCDKSATPRPPSTLCRELDWPLRRLLSELRQKTIEYRADPDVAIDWWAPNIERNNLADLARGEVTVYTRDPKSGAWIGHGVIATVEVWPPQAAEGPPPSANAPVAPASEKKWGRDTTGWARDTIHRLRSKIPKDITQADLARLLENESEEAVRAGEISRAPKASYLENRLRAWGIWPLSSFK
jgi:hypothetical protein